MMIRFIVGMTDVALGGLVDQKLLPVDEARRDLPPSVEETMNAMRDSVPLHVPLGKSTARLGREIRGDRQSELRAMASAVLEATPRLAPTLRSSSELPAGP